MGALAGLDDLVELAQLLVCLAALQLAKQDEVDGRVDLLQLLCQAGEALLTVLDSGADECDDALSLCLVLAMFQSELL